MEKLKILTVVHFLILSLESRRMHLYLWMNKMHQQSIHPLIEKPEDDLDKVIMKRMKLAEIERRFTEKTFYKDRTISEANQLLLEADNQEVQTLITVITDRWNNLYTVIKTQKHRLDDISSNWQEFKTVAEQLEQWLATMLISVESGIVHSNIDSVKMEQEMIKNIENQLKTKYQIKETLKSLRESIVQCINNKPCKSIESQMDKVETLWLNLQKVIHERMRYLADLRDEVEWIGINEMLLSLTKCINNGEEILERYTIKPATSSSELEEGICVCEVNHIILFLLKKICLCIFPRHYCFSGVGSCIT